MNKKGELVKNTAIIFIGKFFTQFVSFLLLPLYTTYLNTSDYGIWDLLLTYITLLIPILSLQLDSAAFRFLIDATNKSKQKNIISSSFLVTCFNILIAVIIFTVVNVFTSINYYIYILLLFVMCAISSFMLQIVRGLGSTLKYSVATTITGVTCIILNVILIVFCGLGIKGLFIAQIVSNLFCILYLLFSMKIYTYISVNNLDKELIKKMLSYSLPLIPNGISWWVISVSDRTIISLFLTTAANGIYAISNKLSTIINSFLSIFNLAWSESASRYINSDDASCYYTDICNDTISLFSFLTMLLLSFFPIVFDYVINESYSEAYLYVPILIISALFNAVVQVYSGIYTAKKMTKQIAITSFLAALINIVVNLSLIRNIGLYAAAISTLISYLVIMIYRYIDIKKYVDIKYDYKSILIYMISIIFCTVCYYLKIKVLSLVLLFIILVFMWFVWGQRFKKLILLIYNKITSKKVLNR